MISLICAKDCVLRTFKKFYNEAKAVIDLFKNKAVEEEGKTKLRRQLI